MPIFQKANNIIIPKMTRSKKQLCFTPKIYVESLAAISALASASFSFLRFACFVPFLLSAAARDFGLISTRAPAPRPPGAPRFFFAPPTAPTSTTGSSSSILAPGDAAATTAAAAAAAADGRGAAAARTLGAPPIVSNKLMRQFCEIINKSGAARKGATRRVLAWESDSR